MGTQATILVDDVIVVVLVIASKELAAYTRVIWLYAAANFERNSSTVVLATMDMVRLLLKEAAERLSRPPQSITGPLTVSGTVRLLRLASSMIKVPLNER